MQVISHVPAPFATTFPLLSTVHTALLDEEKVAFLAPESTDIEALYGIILDEAVEEKKLSGIRTFALMDIGEIFFDPSK